MILRMENTEIEVTTEQQMEQMEQTTQNTTVEVATATDASPTDAQTLDNEALIQLKAINATLSFWMLIWLVFSMLSRFKSSFIKSTDRME